MPEAKKIIMLEDEEVLGNMYCRALEGAGFKVKLCQEAEDLVKEYEAFEPHLAFLDHALHGEEKRGMELIETLRSSIPNLIIVMLSNYSEFQMREDAIAAGANDYLLKIDTPPQQLVSYVKNLLG